MAQIKIIHNQFLYLSGPRDPNEVESEKQKILEDKQKKVKEQENAKNASSKTQLNQYSKEGLEYLQKQGFKTNPNANPKLGLISQNPNGKVVAEIKPPDLANKSLNNNKDKNITEVKPVAGTPNVIKVDEIKNNKTPTEVKEEKSNINWEKNNSPLPEKLEYNTISDPILTTPIRGGNANRDTSDEPLWINSTSSRTTKGNDIINEDDNSDKYKERIQIKIEDENPDPNDNKNKKKRREKYKKNDKDILLQIEDEILKETLVINPSKFFNEKPFFIKSYSVMDFLTPYIRCFVVLRDYSTGDFRRSDLVQNFFDIPYNFIKSFDLEYKSGSSAAINGVITLKLEDSTGVFANIFAGMFSTLGLVQDPLSKTVKLRIQFGWASKGIKKLSKSEMSKTFYRNHFNEFLIENIDMDYSENFKQEITIKGRQLQTSVDSVVNNPISDYTPRKIIGPSPTKTLRLLQYHTYLKYNTRTLKGSAKDTFYYEFFTKHLKKPKNLLDDPKNRENIYKILDDFIALKTKYDDKLVDETFQKKFNNFEKNKFSVTNTKHPNLLFNAFSIKENNKSLEQICILLDSKLNEAYFHPYVILCFMINTYINEVLSETQFRTNAMDFDDCFVLEYYSLTDIKRFGMNDNLLSVATYTNFCINDIEATEKQKPKTQVMLYNTFGIQNNMNWNDMFSNLASLIKIEKASSYSGQIKDNLFINYNKYLTGQDETKFDPDASKDGIFSMGAQKLVDKFEGLIKKLNEYARDSKKTNEYERTINSLTVELNEIKKRAGSTSKKDFIYFIINPGAFFLGEENFNDLLILQKYTVYPHINSTTNLLFQNFNSGRKKYQDGSFPDVISFRPKINFYQIINSNILQVSNIEYYSGYVIYKGNERLSINIEGIDDINNRIKTRDLIEQTIKFLILYSTSNNAMIFFKKKEDDFYYIQGESVGIKGTTVDQIVKNPNSLSSGITGADTAIVKLHIKKGSSDHPQVMILLDNLIRDLNLYYTDVAHNYTYKQINNAFQKSINVSPSDNSTSEFYNYEAMANIYNSQLLKSASTFEAELKILGEPAFTFDFSPISNIYLEVNNINGTKNPFLSGVYYIYGIRHLIESNEFSTTLSLRYIPPKILTTKIQHFNESEDIKTV
jgi:hypothetical protein